MDIQQTLAEIEAQVVALASQMSKRFRDEAIADGRALLVTIREDLTRWLNLLEAGEITADEFQWLLNSSKSQVKMMALRQAGYAALKTKKFVAAIGDIILEAVLKAKQV